MKFWGLFAQMIARRRHLSFAWAPGAADAVVGAGAEGVGRRTWPPQPPIHGRCPYGRAGRPNAWARIIAGAHWARALGQSIVVPNNNVLFGVLAGRPMGVA